ncbi:lipopolysaccharide biosynthesis protein [Pseudonocardia nigra]|uniref:lipopolysaccharide biosynthesis protein n=1 Tax=Pseudonocardia nigra TaxID=1921578 RepID=UPI001C5EC6BB|nr:lipopolysaccharide biosynthesis protein [Pseudonocardia nigra]
MTQRDSRSPCFGVEKPATPIPVAPEAATAPAPSADHPSDAVSSSTAPQSSPDDPATTPIPRPGNPARPNPGTADTRGHADPEPTGNAGPAAEPDFDGKLHLDTGGEPNPNDQSNHQDNPTARLDVSTVGTDALSDDLATDRLSLAEIKQARVKSGAQRRNVRRNALQLVVAGGVLPLVSLATGPLLAAFLGPEGRGYLSAILAAVLLMPFVLAIGLTDAATYLVARRRQHVSTVAFTLGSSQAVTGLLGAGMLWVLAPYIMGDYEPGVLLLRLAALTLIPTMALRAVSGARMGEGRYDLLVRERWMVGLGRLVLLVLLAIGGVLTVATATFAQVGMLVAAQLVLLTGLSRPRLQWRRLRALGGAAYAYGFRSWGGELSNVLIWRLDQVVLLPLAGAAQLGYYAVAVSLAEVPRMLVSDLRAILLSEVAATRDTQAAARACRMSVIALTVPVLAFMVVTPFVLPLLFTEAFRPAVPMAEVLLLGTIPSGVNIFIAGSISALGRPGIQSWACAIGVVVVVTGLIVLAPLLGGMGAAWTTLAAAVAVNGVLAYAFWRTTGVGPTTLLLPRPADLRALVGTVRRRGKK